MDNQNKKFNHWFLVSMAISGLLIAGALVYDAGSESLSLESDDKAQKEEYVELPVKWGGLGRRLIETGVIDKEKFEALYGEGNFLSAEQKNILSGENNGNIKIDSENAGFWLNLLWALGLGNKNEILENGPMTDPRYGGPQNFASTAGWTINNGSAMEYYSKHEFVNLTLEQQALVERVSKNIYRPCCDNPAHFPDCNHGMAMLGFLELAAPQGAGEKELYEMALILNSYWFPETYLTIDKYFGNGVNPKDALGYSFSSGSGFRKILAQVENSGTKTGISCGI